MGQFFAEAVELDIPDWVKDIHSFRRWHDSDDFPAQGRIWWLCGRTWADMSKEQVFTHNAVKTEITAVLHGLAKVEGLGSVFSDGLSLSSFVADISGNPDATFISNESLGSDRIRLLEGSKEGFVEVQGSPDMVLEVVSKASVHKDTVVLRRAYWEAGIREYWLVDARKETPEFDILRYTVRGYVAARKRDEWARSVVFGKEFRFRQTRTALGHPQYSLDMR